jgi:ubiquinone/menaquinone biosynthesis C-methylase UbiE
MTQAQSEAEQCGLIPEENNPWFFAQHLSAYAFARPRMAGRSILEVGFGDGYGAAYLAETVRQVTAVDMTAGNVPRARSKYPRPNLSFQGFDGLHLPFPENSFDAACAFQVIEHIPEPQLLPWLTEIRRVLKQDGLLFFSTLNLDHSRKPGKLYEKLIYHEKEFTAPELEDLLKQVFPRVTLHGLHPTALHRLFHRLKKWNFRVDAYFRRITVRDYVVTRANLLSSWDLIAICEKRDHA